jgi:type IV secretion system protein VirD4
MRALGGFTSQSYLAAVHSTLGDKQAALSTASRALIGTLTDKQLKQFYESKHPNKASYGDIVGTMVPLLAPQVGLLALLGPFLSFRINRERHRNQTSTFAHLIQCFTVARPVLTLNNKEIALVRAMAALTAQRLVTPDQWAEFHDRVCYGDGKTMVLTIDPAQAGHARAHDARNLLTDLLAHVLPNYDAYLGQVGQQIAGFSGGAGAPGAAIKQTMISGASWMAASDIATSKHLTLNRSKNSLLIGYTEDTQEAVYFDGNESLISIGGPNTAKSQAQVITNLLLSPGSAIVLDVKGELWDATAAHRQASFGPVYRFAPTDPTGRSHRFNPMDFISHKPADAAVDCEVFGYQIIANNPKAHDPYWESKGRDFLWAFATTLAIQAEPKYRTMERLAELTALPLTLTKADDPTSLHPDTKAVVDLFSRLAADHDIPDLQQAATSLRTGIGTEGTRLDSVLDTARRFMSPFSRATTVRDAMSQSDWHPLDLRRKPGTTVYICIPDDQLETFAPIVRLMFFQHLRQLKPHRAAPGEPPITFYLDEMPALGNFQAILTMQDTGRSAGLRLWMFAQSFGQIRNAFGQERGEGLVGAARVRCFMQPDDRTARMISETLGKTRNMFTGEEKPLATSAELQSRRYGDKILTLTRGEDPIALDKRLAVHTLKHLMKPPPVVPVARRT